MTISNAVHSFNRTRIGEFYSRYDESLIRDIASIIEPDRAAIADRFYEVMLTDSRASDFLDSDLVNNRLHASMESWISDLFVYRSDEAIDEFINNQVMVGNVHERIDMPMFLVEYGMLVIKDEICLRLQNSQLNRSEVSRALMFVSQLIDYATVIINESFVSNSIDHDRRTDMLQTQSVNASLAYECAQLRTTLSGWFCDLLIALHRQNKINMQDVDIWHANVGLWIRHRAKSIFVDNEEIKKIDGKLHEIEAELKKTLAHHANEDNGNLINSIEKLKEEVAETDWLIEALEKTAMEQEKGHDVLTNLFNRRYLPNIIKSEMRFNQQRGSQFAILYIDIDNFKNINDRFGHDKGDYVLNEISYVLLHSVRVGDYVFRYGGEEFLIVLTEATVKVALQVAENLRAKVESHIFSMEEGVNGKVTLSIGVAMSETEKDFEIIIKKADKALLRAKQSGKNRCLLSDQEAG